MESFTSNALFYIPFIALILLNVGMFYIIYISKKYHGLKLVTGALFNLIKNMQASDPIGLRAEIQKLEEFPREIIESMIYGKS